jgi:hypothetical protein
VMLVGVVDDDAGPDVDECGTEIDGEDRYGPKVVVFETKAGLGTWRGTGCDSRLGLGAAAPKPRPVVGIGDIGVKSKPAEEGVVNP